MARENARNFFDPSLNGVIRQIVALPRRIIGEVSKKISQEISSMGNLGRNQNPQPPFPLQPQQEPSHIQEQWVFLSSFEQQFGSCHPFFYACSFMEALKIAKDEHKFMFVYLHCLEHPFTSSFCTDTLCSELIVQFLDANFVSWGGVIDRGEGMKMAATFRPASFPFCALIAHSLDDDNVVVLQQMEGPISPAELVEILQGTVEEQGLAFVNSGTDPGMEKMKADRRLKEEQDAAYFAALHVDEEKQRLENSHAENYDKFKSSVTIQHQDKGKETSGTVKTTQQKETSNSKKEATQILIRFPNGERREVGFSSTDEVEVIFGHIDSLGLTGIGGNYRLITSFPRRVYGAENMGTTLMDAGLHPRASLFLEFI